MTALTVYKASAGSGKTFTLAVEYIKLLIQNPQAFRQTLAVTFTNKATEEMKMRILSQLYGIWRGLDSSKAYTDSVCQQLGVSPQMAAERAGEALHLLLHNYSYLRVETIDAFFQSVLRNLARELELTANLRVGLNDAQVEEQAVDQLIDSLQASDLMLQWLLRYIMDNISDDRSWNVIGQIKQFGKTIFRDYYKQESKELGKVTAKKDFFETYAATLRRERQTACERMEQIATTFFSTIEGEGLTVDDFANKSRGVCSIFLKMQRGTFDEGIITKTVADAVGQPSKWYAKSSPRAAFIHALVDSRLDALLRQAIDEQPRQWRRFKSADLTLRHLSQLRLLGSIETQVRQMNQEANRFLLSDTQQLLHDIIDHNDSPFIFEKIGTRLEHIMIDEFQDTSTVQWQNFRILLQEAMSHAGSSSLIVGDVKQSIYRWRSGDWRLLANIKEEFNGNGQQIEIKRLDTNYRSSQNVIAFNNAFFTEAARQEEATAYDDVEQKWLKDKPKEGMVSVRLLPQTDYSQATLDLIVEQIEQITANGVKPSDIAILVRSNSYIPLIANYLLEQLPEMKVVSDEAFRLDASPAVMVIIKALHLLFHPEDDIARAFLAKTVSGRLDGPLPEAFTTQAETLRRMSLTDLTEKLYALFIGGMAVANSSLITSHSSLFTSQSAYLCAFFDHVTAYCYEKAGDAIAFLREWDESLCAKTIQSPELDGLRIISIHKSKGLEFPHVIIPFCDWKLEHSDILWCRPQEEPFNALPLAPIDYSQKGMKGTIYEKDYEEEHQQNTVDNLNLLYVAFTRASQSLFVIGKRGSKASRSVLIEQVLPQLTLEGATLSGKEDAEGPICFDFGSLPSTDLDKLKSLQGQAAATVGNVACLIPPTNAPTNPFLQTSIPIPVDIEVSDQFVDFRQSAKSQKFAQAEDDDNEQKNNYIQLGNVLHNIFSSIRTIADTDTALKQLEQEGIIYSQDITRKKLEAMIRKRLTDPRVAHWFSDRWQLYNECAILLPNGETRRPDRVMTDGRQTIVVDFKFGQERDEYHHQVREYMQLLRQMGMPAVKGFLWFVYANRIVEVSLK